MDKFWAQDSGSFIHYFAQLVRLMPKGAPKIHLADHAELLLVFGKIPFGAFYLAGLDLLETEEEFPPIAKILKKCEWYRNNWKDYLEIRCEIRKYFPKSDSLDALIA